MYASLPYIREPIPVAFLFRALRCVSDKAILSKVVYDSGDAEMSTALRPSLEEAMIINSEEDALDFIARRGSAT